MRVVNRGIEHSSRGKNSCKSSEMGACLECSKIRKDASMSGSE